MYYSVVCFVMFGGPAWRLMEVYGVLPDIILLTQGYSVYYIVSVLFLLLVWCPCMAIYVSVQYNGGLLPDTTLLTQCYYHRGTR